MLMNQISPACCLRQQTNEFRDSDFHQEVAKESDCHQWDWRPPEVWRILWRKWKNYFQFSAILASLSQGVKYKAQIEKEMLKEDRNSVNLLQPVLFFYKKSYISSPLSHSGSLGLLLIRCHSQLGPSFILSAFRWGRRGGGRHSMCLQRVIIMREQW